VRPKGRGFRVLFNKLGGDMFGLARKVKRRLGQLWENQRQRHQLARCTRRTQTTSTFSAISARPWVAEASPRFRHRSRRFLWVLFGQDFDVSYPETTGYIAQTFVEQERVTGCADLLERAVAMADWEIAIQLPEGAVMGSKFNRQPIPAVFNTGMVLLGWSALIQRTGEDRFKQAARRASDWLVSMQEPDGRWIRGNSNFARAESTLYNVKAPGDCVKPEPLSLRSASFRPPCAKPSTVSRAKCRTGGFRIAAFRTHTRRYCTLSRMPCRG